MNDLNLFHLVRRWEVHVGDKASSAFAVPGRVVVGDYAVHVGVEALPDRMPPPLTALDGS